MSYEQSGIDKLLATFEERTFALLIYGCSLFIAHNYDIAMIAYFVRIVCTRWTNNRQIFVTLTYIVFLDFRSDGKLSE